jgi:hypothetical protein
MDERTVLRMAEGLRGMPVTSEWGPDRHIHVRCRRASHPIKLPHDLPNRHVSPPRPVRPNDHPQVVVEPTEPRLSDLLSRTVGPGRAGQPRLGVNERAKLPVDQNVVLGAGLRYGGSA